MPSIKVTQNLGLISRPLAKMLSLAQHPDYAQHLSVYAVSYTVLTMFSINKLILILTVFYINKLILLTVFLINKLTLLTVFFINKLALLTGFFINKLILLTGFL